MKQARSKQLTHPLQTGQAPRAYWSGFSVFLFVLLLAVFTWALHRRVAQYESMQPVGSHGPAAQMCLTERNRMSLPTTAAMEVPDAANLMVLFLAFLVVSSGCCGLPGALALRSRPRASGDDRLGPDLNYFFFLPPPCLPFSA